MDSLLELRQRIEAPGSPVLFLTNDTMVRNVGAEWRRLDSHYALSWAHAREVLTPLLEKSALEARCQATDIAYPRTVVLMSSDEIEAAVGAIGFPMIVKPTRPLSGFKTAQPESAAALQALADRHADDMPFLVQPFIPGDDTRIHFCALYLDRGRPLARFEGHKLRSRPMGHTSIAEPLVNDQVHAATLRFFEGLELSGPVSLELKRGPDERLWVIEPTIGRTDFWVGLCVENGVNLPLVEYQHQAGIEIRPAPMQRDEVVWFNEDRDPLGRGWLAMPTRPSMKGRRSAFVFLHRSDPRPTQAFLRQLARRYFTAAVRRLPALRSASDRPVTIARPVASACNVAHNFDALPVNLDWDALRGAAPTVFETADWFRTLTETCPARDLTPLLLTCLDNDGQTLLALRERVDGHVESLSNYYAALFGPASTDKAIAVRHAPQLAATLVARGAATIRMHPVDVDAPFWRAFRAELRRRGYWVDRYYAFGNWFHPCAGIDGASYIAARPSRLRHTIARTRRKLHADPSFALRLLDQSASNVAVNDAVRDFEFVYAKSWKKPEPYPSFIGDLCRMAHAHGWLRMVLCNLDGQPVAAQIWLVQGGVASIFKLAYDEKFAKRGVGTIASAAMSEHVLDVDQVSIIDFAVGDDAYKSEWMDCRRERHGIVAFRPTSWRGFTHGVRHFAARLFRFWRNLGKRPTAESNSEPRFVRNLADGS